MLPVALAAALTATVSDGFDWSKASDDLRFASLKPVMTLAEAERLRAGRAPEMIGCGVARSEHGHKVGAYTNGYTLKPTGHNDGVAVTFRSHGPDGKVAGSVGRVVGFWVNGVAYKRNKEGLFVAQPAKK